MAFPQSNINWNKYFTSLNAIWEILISKANTDLMNTPNNVDFVVEYKEFANGSWYKLYKSGWLEQGGIYSTEFVNTSVDINLLKNFLNTTYTLVVSGDVLSEDRAKSPLNIENKELAKFKVGSISLYQKGFNWYTCGMSK